MSDVEAIKADLIEGVLENWNVNQAPYLLSKLGQDLGRKGHNLKSALKRRKLAGFIGEELKSDLTIVPDPADEKILWVVPAHVPAEEVPIPERLPKEKRAPRLPIDRRILAAFTSPIEDDLVRSISFEPELFITEISRATAGAQKKPFVDGSDVLPAPVGTPDERDKLQERILAWASKFDVPASSLAPRPSSSRDARVSLWAKLLEALDADELARISMPLDIVTKLMKVPGP